MGDVYRKTREVFEKELEKIVNKGDVTASDLELTYKIVDILKDISKICKIDSEMEYEDDYSGRNYDYRGTMWGQNSRRSRNSSMIGRLQNLMNEAGNEHERMMIQSWMDDLKN